MTVIGVIGSRGFNNYELLVNTLDLELRRYTTDLKIISGGAYGADKLAIVYAKSHGINHKEYKPDFSRGYNVKEYFIRNDLIISNSDKIIAFWDGLSRGTKYVIYTCNKVGKTVEVVRF